jgi:DNA helicase-2/ATP-dependent DNA helicase PcrA
MKEFGGMKESEFWQTMSEKGVKLTPVQVEAVRRTEGPLLLLAVPGSGKTTAVLSRIGYLMLVKGIEARRIKAASFNRAAAEEMKQRFAAWFPELSAPGFSTLHSLAFEVMREDYRRRGLAFHILEGNREDSEAGASSAAIVTEDAEPLSKRRILRRLYRTVAGEPPTEEQVEELMNWIGCIKNSLVPERNWEKRQDGLPHAAEVLRAYERFKADYPTGRLVDYDDMLTLANEALERDPSLLRRYQDGYDYLLTDESQDNSLIQHAIVEKLARRKRNLCVVADDDQSIYGWRGADPGYLLDFRRTYPDAAVLFMEQNFRSSPEIVSAADRFIARNRSRYVKRMTTMNPSHEPIRFSSFGEYTEQTEYLVSEIGRAPDLSQVAVLYRTNRSASALADRLDRAGIPFRLKDRDKQELHHWVVEDMLNFMRLTYTERRLDLLERVYSKMKGYLSKVQMAEVRDNAGESVFDALLALPSMKEYQVGPLTEARDLLRRLKGAAPLAAIRAFRSELGYDKALEKQCARMGTNADYLFDLLATLEDIAQPLASMEEFAQRISYLRMRLAQAGPRKGQPAVTLSTLHSAKGLEFDRVYLIDLVEGSFPSKDEASAGRIEEAVRLFYVGMTRARQRLELVAYRARGQKKLVESRFMKAIRELSSEAGGRSRAPHRAGSRTVGSAPSGRRAVAPSRPVPGTSHSAAARPTAGRTAQTAQTGLTAQPPWRPSSEGQRLLERLVVHARVRHSLIGDGEVVSLDGEMIRIRFGTEDRRFSLPVCVEMGLLEPI